MKNLNDFKEQIESITYADVVNLRVVKHSKTIESHLNRIKLGRFEKSEINAFTKLFSSYKFSDEGRKKEIDSLKQLSMNCVDSGLHIFSNIYGDVMHFKKGMKISKEQTQLGKAWLKEFFFKKNGESRSGNNTRYVSDRVLSISKSVSKFEFIGIIICKNPYGDTNNVLPIYRTYNRKGEYFDYSPIHWSQPIIMEGM